MKINELKAGTSSVDVQAEVVQKEEPREVVTKFGKRLSVANITLKDDTGTIAMSLWGEDIEKINVGDVIDITNGYVNEFRGIPQLSTGRFGKIEVVSQTEGSSSESNYDKSAETEEPVESDESEEPVESDESEEPVESDEPINEDEAF